MVHRHSGGQLVAAAAAAATSRARDLFLDERVITERTERGLATERSKIGRNVAHARCRQLPKPSVRAIGTAGQIWPGRQHRH